VPGLKMAAAARAWGRHGDGVGLGGAWARPERGLEASALSLGPGVMAGGAVVVL